MKVKQQQESTMNYKIKGCSRLEIYTTKCKYDEHLKVILQNKSMLNVWKLSTTKQVQYNVGTLERCTKNESTLEIVLSFQNFAENI